MNKLTKIHAHLLKDAHNLEFLFLQHNEITGIPDNLFQNASSLKYVFLNNNNLTVIGPGSFRGASNLKTLALSNNHKLADLESDSFNYADFGNLSLLYVLETALVRVNMKTFTNHEKVGLVISPAENVFQFPAPLDERFREGLERNGFTCNQHLCTPCDFGTYQKGASNGSYVCEKCPPGGFYQNAVGQFGTIAGRTGCLPCPKGTYLEIDKFPGKRRQMCRVCPAGRFTQCEACPTDVRGILCNETILVKEGYWWRFRDYNESWEYQRFVDTLMVPGEQYNHKDINFTGIFPRPYPCPTASSCLGSLNSVRKPCNTGYGGPLCEVCNKGYYKSLTRCTKCPSLLWLLAQMAAIAFVIIILIFILVRDERGAKIKGRTLSDIVLARLKIVIGFYQVTAGTLDAFSYVQWPEALLQLNNYFKFVQFNVVQIAPFLCFKDSLKMNAYVGLLLIMSVNGGIIVSAFVYFQSRKLFIRLKKNLSSEEKEVEISLSKEHCYRTAFLVMFITYPEVSSRILRMLPPACHKICQDVAMKDCTYYLKMDYSLKCFDKSYRKYVTVAYVGAAYPLLFPLFIVCILYLLYYRPQVKNRDQSTETKRDQITEGMRFIYENYDKRCWYWELVEMVRKLILTSGLALIGAEGRTYVGMVAMASGFYAVAYAQAQPIPYKFEHLLQLVSLVATFFSLSVGVLLRIPSEMLNYSIEKDKDSIGITVLLVTANLMVIGLVVVRYIISLGQSLYGVCKNPQCNWECCLRVVLSAQSANTDEEDIDSGGHNRVESTMKSISSNMGMGEDGVENWNSGGNDNEATQNDWCSFLSLEDDNNEIEFSCGSQAKHEDESLEVEMASLKGDSNIPEVQFKRGYTGVSINHPAAASKKVVTEVNKSHEQSLDLTYSVVTKKKREEKAK
ncbi:putative leucine-rich repeat-containing protein DDB_G0281931 isoform X2 [Stylophora pistillata]|uniref:putative leucine-rich repeat-containing protein DDB_G0281931 isoform X2 n=1 Tax=Stylophora pistillata TaxID=50429 RepID=UPI000C0472DC|nr:putative leucine-rich repeat-containing protein DDB_G0281931 isoform X2 [Stylophora pistillata]